MADGLFNQGGEYIVILKSIQLGKNSAKAMQSVFLSFPERAFSHGFNCVFKLHFEGH